MRFSALDAVVGIMDANDKAYYLRRILQEEEAARTASCSVARERHEELAAAYQLRCRMDALAPPMHDEIHCAA